MKKLAIAFLLLPFSYGVANAQAGDAAAGKTIWEGAACKNCHGENGEGAFGPDLAGRGLNVAQFTQAVRKPWGIMPAFVETQFSDKQLGDLTAYFAGMPKAAAPGKWRFEPTAGSAAGQQVAVNLGCAQCHGPTLNGPRGNLGAVQADYDYFANLVYNHTTAMPQHRMLLNGNANGNVNMGNFNPVRVTPASLREIYAWIKDDIGFRVPLQARLGKGETAANGVTYKLDVTNNGLPGKGVTAQGVTVRLIVPQGASVVSATGAGYQGAKMEGQAMVATWQVASLAPKDQQSYTITLSKPGTQQDNLRGNIKWASPAPKVTKADDVVNITPAPL